jgi:uncharacterized protein (DUF2235 family)
MPITDTLGRRPAVFKSHQAGVGTYFAPGVVAPMFRWGAKVLDEAFAWYLPTHVTDGYKFLMQNFAIGDKVCLFGTNSF